MEYLKETNKNLMGLRASLITVVIVITSGLAGLVLAKSFNPVNIFVLFIPGIYFDVIFLQNILSINEKINNNIMRMNNGIK